MGENALTRLRNFSWSPAATKKNKPEATAAARVKVPTDAFHASLFWLVQNIADRFKPNTAPFDTHRMTAALQASIAGGELKLCNLDPETKSLFEAFTLENWKQLQAAAALRGGGGVAYAEIDAELLGRVLPGLQSLPNLDCVSVWAPPEGGSIDFGFLEGTNGPLRINILGTPAKPLKITVRDGVKIEGKESQNRAIQKSVVRKRDASGNLSAESTPLPLAGPPMAAIHPLQIAPPDDLSVGVKALMRGSTYDASGKFGLDLNKLSPEQVGLVQALGDQVWTAIEADAKRAGLKISWIQLNKELRLDLALMRSLKRLSPHITISVDTPPPGAAEDHHAQPPSSELAPAALLPRESPREAGFDDVRSAVRTLMNCASFDARGRLGIDVTHFSKEEVRAMQKLGADLWTALQAKSKKSGLQINWLRLHDDFTLSRAMVVGLKEFGSLRSLSVATPARGILLNLSQLQGSALRDVEVRCGTGRKWTVIVPDEVEVRPSSEADDADANLMQSKVFYEKDGKVIRERPLFQPPPAVIEIERAEAAACANDEELRDTLIGLMKDVAIRKPQFDRRQIGAVAQAIMSCGSVDENNEFGWDFKGKLPAAYVPWLLELGVEAFTALQDSNERAGTCATWVDLNDEFVVNPDLVDMLREFTLLTRLTIAAPAKGVFLSVGALQGNGVRLKELRIRNAHDRKLCVTVPGTVATVRPEDATSVSGPQSWALTFEIDKDYYEVPPPPVGPEALRGTLVDMFKTMNSLSHHVGRATPKAAAQAVLDCGSFDEHGHFGWDFTKLPPDCAPWLQDMPIEGFKALQRCAQETALGTAWLALPDEFVVNQDLVAKLTVLAPLRTLRIPAPSLYLDLRGLRGGRIEFDSLLIRRQTGKLRLDVPDRVKEIRSEGPGAQDLLNQSRIAYCDASGKRVVQTVGPRHPA